jgi:predicted nucleotidyltransferase
MSGRVEPLVSATLLADLPAGVGVILREFVDALLQAAPAEIESVILFGSAAEGRLRSTSDVNLLVVSSGLKPEQLDAIRTPLRAGKSAVGLSVMFLEAVELPHAFEAFAVKFSDIKDRHRVLYGRSMFDSIEISREAALRRLRQVLLNLTLRLRERYAIEGDHEEALARVIADTTGPLRASAAVLLALRDGKHRQPKVALEEFCSKGVAGVVGGVDGGWDRCLVDLSTVHRGERLPGGATRALFADVIRVLMKLDAAAHSLG